MSGPRAEAAAKERATTPERLARRLARRPRRHRPSRDGPRPGVQVLQRAIRSRRTWSTIGDVTPLSRANAYAVVRRRTLRPAPLDGPRGGRDARRGGNHRRRRHCVCGRRLRPPKPGHGRSAGSRTSATWRARSCSRSTTRSKASPAPRPRAKLIVQKSVEYLESLAKESAGDVGLQQELARAFVRVGDVQGNPTSANVGDATGALRSYGRAMVIAEANARELRPENVDARAHAGTGPPEARRRAGADRRQGRSPGGPRKVVAAVPGPRGTVAQASLDDKLEAGIAHLKLGDLLGNPNFENLGRAEDARGGVCPARWRRSGGCRPKRPTTGACAASWASRSSARERCTNRRATGEHRRAGVPGTRTRFGTRSPTAQALASGHGPRPGRGAREAGERAPRAGRARRPRCRAIARRWPCSSGWRAWTPATPTPRARWPSAAKSSGGAVRETGEPRRGHQRCSSPPSPRIATWRRWTPATCARPATSRGWPKSLGDLRAESGDARERLSGVRALARELPWRASATRAAAASRGRSRASPPKLRHCGS